MKTLPELMEKHGFAKTERKSYAMHDAVFYQTSLENVFISDWDLFNDRMMPSNTCLAFNSKTGKRIPMHFDFIDGLRPEMLKAMLEAVCP